MTRERTRRNPPAFPRAVSDPMVEMPQIGMDLHTYFAAKAMQALLPLFYRDGMSFDVVAHDALEMADQMMNLMEERNA